LYPPLRKGRLGGDDCTKKLPTPCLQIINSLLCGHPLLRLPFPRGGYQLAFPLLLYMELAGVCAQAPEYPPLRKGRLGGDDCTKRLPTACLQIINSLLYGHPLLRLPFPRGGYQLAFPLIVPYLSLPTVNLPAAEKILCYSVFYPQQPSSRKPSAAEKILCYSVFNPPQQQKKYFVTLSLIPRSSRKNTLLCCLFYLPPVQQIITARHGDASQAP
jgi:hypothetical protein